MKRKITPEELEKIKDKLHRDVDLLHAGICESFTSYDLFHMIQLTNAANELTGTMPLSLYLSQLNQAMRYAVISPEDKGSEFQHSNDYIKETINVSTYISNFLAAAFDYS